MPSGEGGCNPRWAGAIYMAHALLDSAATFRRGAAEKVSFVLLNQLDLVLTVVALCIGLQELNPIMRSAATSPLQLVLLKLALPLLIAWLVPGKLLLPAIALLAFVVGWDVKELLLGIP